MKHPARHLHELDTMTGRSARNNRARNYLDALHRARTRLDAVRFALLLALATLAGWTVFRIIFHP